MPCEIQIFVCQTYTSTIEDEGLRIALRATDAILDPQSSIFNAFIIFVVDFSQEGL